jgi:hypothetical protein
VTAIARRRTRRTIVGAVAAVLLVMAASAMFVVGVVTLSNSQEGEAVGVDTRPRMQLPATPNALLAVTDENGRLASVVVMTLLPEGQGGSIVTVPVNADTTAGFGLQRRPLDESFEADDVEELIASVEEMLAITVQRAEIVDADGLEALLPDVDALRFVVPNDVIDTQGGGGVISTAGPQRFTRSEMVSILTAIDDDAEVDISHANDVVVWEALAQTAPVSVPPEPVPLDELGRPIAPATVGELMTRLWQGEVAVRDLLVIPIAEDENPTGVDVVLIDRRDSNLVFAQVSPGLVSTPNTGLTVRIVANFTDDELAEAGGAYESTSDLAVELIGRLLFLGGNVPSVDTAPTGAPPITIIEVAEARQIQESIEAAEALFGEAEVRVAETVIEGIDVEVTLGMSYLAREAERLSDATPDTGPTESTEVAGTVPDDG